MGAPKVFISYAHEDAPQARRLANQLVREGAIDLWWLEAEMYRLRGELLLRKEPPDETAAEQSFVTARGIARAQDAIALELRTAMSHGVLLHGKGKGAEAVESIAVLYGRFRSGFDTADMDKAKKLVRDWTEKRAAATL